MEKEYIDHFSGLKASSDGEFLVPKSGTHPEHYTYGYQDKVYKTIRYNGKNYLVHKLVAEVYLNNNQPIDSKKYHVHHLNENKTDNRVENLIILTHKEHHRLHKTGKLHTEEHKRKISEALKGEKNPFFGKHHTEETKQKISESRLKNPLSD